jgi:CDP-diacylglycerol--serine O-phosphatidyltransferase
MAAHDRPRGSQSRPRGVYWLPNLLTTGALFAGFYAVVAAIDLEVRLRRRRRVRRHGVRRTRRPRGALDAHRERVRQGVRQPVRHGVFRHRAGHRYLSMGRRAHRRVRPLVAQGRLARVFFLCGRRGAAARALQLALGHQDKHYFEGLPSPSAAAIVAASIWLASDRVNVGFPVSSSRSWSRRARARS